MDDENSYYITNDITEAFCIVGSVDEHIKKLSELEAAGISQFNIYLCAGEEERQIAEYGEHILPYFQGK